MMRPRLRKATILSYHSAHCDEQGTDRGDGGTEPRDAASRGGASSVPFDGGMNVSAPPPAKKVVDAST